MGFAEEVRQVVSSKAAAPEVSSPAPEAEASSGITAESGGPEQDIVLATGTQPVEPGAPVVVLEPKADPNAEPPPPAPIKIAGKEFKSMDAAIAYAEQLELAHREEKAFQDGYQKAEAKNQPAEPPVKGLDELVEEKLFENPKEAIKMLRDGIQKEIYEGLTKAEKQKLEAQQLEQSRTQTWNSFYESNTDLSENRDYVDFLLRKNWDALKDLPTNESLPKLAELARKGLRLTKEQALPAQELQRKPAVMAGVSGNATAQPAQATETKAMDFITQLNKLRKRK